MNKTELKLMKILLSIGSVLVAPEEKLLLKAALRLKEHEMIELTDYGSGWRRATLRVSHNAIGRVDTY